MNTNLPARRRLVALLLFSAGAQLASWLPAAVAEDDEPAATPVVHEQALKTHVEWLAHPDRRGRGDWTSREATSVYIAKHFKAAGLEPLPKQTSYFLDMPQAKPADTNTAKSGAPKGDTPSISHRNVVGWLPVGDAPEEDYLILSAHYDHLGVKALEKTGEENGSGSSSGAKEQIFAGADDNATGVAALLELARVFATLPAEKRKRSLVFVAFDLEEQSLIGSKDYVKRSPLPLSGCAAFVTMDMLGRSLADLVDGSLFVMGTENSAVLDALVRKQPEPEGGGKIILGIDFQPGYSDYVAFRDSKVPYIFLTSGACSDYHRATDTAARIQWGHLQARSEWVRALMAALMEAPQRPAWREGSAPTVGEIEVLQKTLKTVSEKIADVPGVPPQAAPMLANFLKFIDGVLSDGEVTEAERKNVKNTTLMLFRFAQAAGGGDPEGAAARRR